MNTQYTIIIAAVLPAVVLLVWIYIRDKYQREPLSMVLKGFGFGVLSAFVSLMFSLLFVSWLVPIDVESISTVRQAFTAAFVQAAIPEECAKLFMLWLLLRKNKYFDEYADGLVYAASVGLGFAAIENVAYLFNAEDGWRVLAATRGILSVPAHYMFALVMGYFYSLVCFGNGSLLNRLSVLLAPVLLHGTYDLLLMLGGVEYVNYPLTVICFLLFFVCMLFFATKLMSKHLKRDFERSLRRWMDEHGR